MGNFATLSFWPGMIHYSFITMMLVIIIHFEIFAYMHYMFWNSTCIFAIRSLSLVWLFATMWTAARQASQSFIISQSLLKLMSISISN